MSEIHGATGSYVLHALDPSELDEFEAHLAVCPTCSQEVVEFCETAAELSLLANATPPPALRSSVLSAISGVRVLPPEAPAEPEPAPVQAAAPPATEVATVAPVDELALRRQRRTTRLLSLAVAAAMVVALSLGAWVVDLSRQRDSQIASTTLETQLYSAPDVKAYPVELANGARASFVASKSLNRALFTSSELPSVGEDRTYQLWTLQGEQATRDNLVSGGTAVKQWFTGPVADSSGLAVSIEPAGGSVQPTVANILKVQAL
jgi:anti-sigma-K factor RskA